MLKSPFQVGTPAQVYMLYSGQLRICGISFMLSHPSAQLRCCIIRLSSLCVPVTRLRSKEKLYRPDVSNL